MKSRVSFREMIRHRYLHNYLFMKDIVDFSYSIGMDGVCKNARTKYERFTRRTRRN